MCPDRCPIWAHLFIIPHLEFIEFHISFHNLIQIFRELRSRAHEEFRVCPSHHPRYTKTKDHPKMIQQVMGTEKMTKTKRDIKVPYDEGLLPAQSYGSDDQHGDGKDHRRHMMDLTWRPHWSATQGSATKFDLCSDRTKDRDTMYNLRDSKNNYEEGIQDVSNEVVEKEVQMVEDSPELAEDDDGKIINMNSMKDIEVTPAWKFAATKYG